MVIIVLPISGHQIKINSIINPDGKHTGLARLAFVNDMT